MPALPVLRAQQRDLREWLRAGMPARRDLLLWAHGAAAVSVGEVPDDWFSSLINDQWTVAACLSDPSDRRRLCGDAAPSASQARSRRTEIIRGTLSPAFGKALERVRTHAGDYVEDAQGIKHTDKQRFLALRPRLHQVAVEQHRALLEPFGVGEERPHDRASVVEWADTVAYACAGGSLPSNWPRAVSMPSGEWCDALLNGRSSVLESNLAADVLPAMNEALRTAAKEADELAARRGGGGGNGSIT